MSSEPTWLTGILNRLVDLSHRRPLALVAIFVALGAVATSISMQLQFRGDFIELLPAQSQEVKDLRFVEQRAGGGGYLVTRVTGATPEARRQFAVDFAKKLESTRTDLVRYVEYRFDVRFFHDRALLLLPIDQLTALEKDVGDRIAYEKKIANPLYVDLNDETPPTPFQDLRKKYASDAPTNEFTESKDGKELYLHVKPTGLAGDLDFNRRLVSAAREDAASLTASVPGLTVEFTGPFVIRIEEDEMMQGDLGRAGVLASVIALGVILLATRRFVALVVVAAPVSLGIATTFAFAKVTVGHLNPVTGFLGAILIGLGIEYGVHLAMRYWEERANAEPIDAMRAAVTGTFAGALTSAATNSAAFLVLVLADFDAFRQFGKIAAFGVMATVIAAYLMGPAVLLIAERIRPYRRKANASQKEDDHRASDAKPIPVALLVSILASVVGFAIFSVIVAPKASFETDLKRLKGESPATAMDDHVTEQLGISMTPALLYVQSLEEAKVVSRVVAQVREEGGARTSFHKVLSLNDLLPQDAEAARPIIEKLRKHFDDVPKSMQEGEGGQRLAEFKAMLDAQPWGIEQVPNEIRRRFMALNGGGMFVLVFPRYSGYDTNELNLWAADLDRVIELAKVQHVTLPVLDGNRLASRIFLLVKKDGPFVLGSAAVVVFLMIWLSLQSLKRAVLVAGPLFLGMAGIFGGMYLTDVKLNFLNVVVLPNLLTIAVDNSVHLYHRYHEEGPGSLKHVLRHTGFAAVVATISNAAGYGAMLVAHHAGLRSIAWLAILGVSSTFVGTTVFFPALLALMERARKSEPHTAPKAA